MSKKIMEQPRIVGFKMEKSDYELLKRWWGFNGLEAGDRIRQLLQQDLDSARRFVADVEGN